MFPFAISEKLPKHSQMLFSKLLLRKSHRYMQYRNSFRRLLNREATVDPVYQRQFYRLFSYTNCISLKQIRRLMFWCNKFLPIMSHILQSNNPASFLLKRITDIYTIQIFNDILCRLKLLPKNDPQSTRKNYFVFKKVSYVLYKTMFPFITNYVQLKSYE